MEKSHRILLGSLFHKSRVDDLRTRFNLTLKNAKNVFIKSESYTTTMLSRISDYPTGYWDLIITDSVYEAEDMHIWGGARVIERALREGYHPDTIRIWSGSELGKELADLSVRRCIEILDTKNYLNTSVNQIRDIIHWMRMGENMLEGVHIREDEDNFSL